MTKKLIWRLGKLPSPDEVRELVKDKIITQEEAREILFSSETEEDRDKESLQEEIKFLRKLVEKLSESKTIRIIETIKEVDRPWRRWDWYKPYEIWCSSGSGVYNYTAANSALNTLALNGQITDGSNSITISNKAFSEIKTF